MTSWFWTKRGITYREGGGRRERKLLERGRMTEREDEREEEQVSFFILLSQNKERK